MKRAIILILLLPVVYGLYGGETWTYHFDKCETLEAYIEATSQIDNGEYDVLNNCTKDNNSYSCKCYNNYYFNISFKPNTINNYTITFNYVYLDEQKQTSSKEGGSGSYSGLNIKTLFYVSQGKTIYPTDGLRFPLTIVNITEEFIIITTQGNDYEIKINETKNIEPIGMSLTYYQYSNGRARIKFDETAPIKINATEEIVIEDVNITETINITEEEPEEEELTVEEQPDYTALIIISIIVFLGIVIYLIYLICKKQ